jgi:cysteine-rich repeat protein
MTTVKASLTLPVEPRMRNRRHGARGWLLGPALLLACQDPAAADPAEATDSSSGDGSGTSDDAAPDVPAGCGNGIVEDGEACDLGFANAVDGACTPACALPRCGDGLPAPGEACDEGEANGGPTCSEACTRPTRLRWSTTVGGSAHGWDLAVAMVPVAEQAVVAALSIAGDPSQVVLERREADGTRTWSTTLVGLRYYGLSAHLVAAPDQGVLLSIFADEAGVPLSERVELRRVDASGTTQWRHVVGAGASGRPITGRVTTAGDAVVLTTVLEAGQNQFQTLVTRLDHDGHVQHERMVAASLRTTAGAPDGGLFAHGSNALLRLDADDVLAWSVPAFAQGSAVLTVDHEGQPLLARRDASGARLLQAFTAQGRLRWQAPLELSPRALAVGPGGTIAVAGRADAVPAALPTNLDLAVETFDAAGAHRWLERVDGPGYGEDAAEAVAITPDEAIWAGGSMSVPFESRDAWLGRFEEDPR